MNRPNASLTLGGLLLLLAAAVPASRALASPVYNGGPILTGRPDVYYIWYGNWTGDSATTLLPDLITNLSGTTYMNIATSYSAGSYTVGNQVHYSGSVFVNSTTNSTIYTSNGTSLNGNSTSQFQSIVNSVLALNPSWSART